MGEQPVITKYEPKIRQGLVVILTGNGKGKTTSAMGMVLRASGYGMKVCIIQFMKGDLYSGEWDGVKLLGDRVEPVVVAHDQRQLAVELAGPVAGHRVLQQPGRRRGIRTRQRNRPPAAPRPC